MKSEGRTSKQQLLWAGKKLSKLFIVLLVVWLVVHGWGTLTDHRPFKVEQYYPNETALQQALYKRSPIGSPLEDFMRIMRQSKLEFIGDPVLEHGPIEPYKLRSHGARQVFSYGSSWGCPFLMYGSPIETVSVQVEYSQDEKITGIFVSMGETKCEFGL